MDTKHEYHKDLDRLALLRRDVPVVFEDNDDGTSLAQLHDAGDLEPAQRLDRTDHAQLSCDQHLADSVLTLLQTLPVGLGSRQQRGLYSDYLH